MKCGSIFKSFKSINEWIDLKLHDYNILILGQRTYLPARANESTMKMMNTPKKQYNTNSSVT